MALTAARASAVKGFACFAARPWARAMPFNSRRTPSFVRGVLVAVALVDRGDGGAVEPDAGHREAPVLDQMGEVCGHQGRGGRHGQGYSGLGPLLEGFPGGAVTGPGVVGDAAVQGLADPLVGSVPPLINPSGFLHLPASCQWL